MEAALAPEVIGLREVMVRLWPGYDVPLEQAAQLQVDTGGAEFDAMVALARLGVRSAWVSKLPDSPLGRLIADSGRRHGVDMSLVRWGACGELSPGACPERSRGACPERSRGDNGRVGLYFVEYLRRAGRIRVYYDRQHSTINDLREDEVDWSAFRDARFVHLSGITPALSESCARLVSRAIAEGHAGTARISFDVNYRALLWTPQEAAKCLEPLLKQVDVVISSLKDLQLLFGIGPPAGDAARRARDQFGSEVVALTLGEEGSLAIRGDEEARWVGIPCEEVDRFVAGDCFAAGLLYGLLRDDLQLGVRMGGAMAALKHTIHGDMPWLTASEVADLAAQAQETTAGR